MIKFLLNHIPRGVLQRVARVAMPVARVVYAGTRHECPVCGARLRRFLPYGYVETRKNALCPSCLSLERHRLLWLWLVRESDILSPDKKILHVAPEVCLSKKFEKTYMGSRAVCEVEQKQIDQANYVTADLESPLAKVKMDVQAIPFADETFDVVMCNHVLEHVADDRKAIKELHRVTKKGGLGILLSPVDEARAATHEDDSITDLGERTRIFGQYDHRRVYGCDYADRLREAGWDVEKNDYLAQFSAADQKRFGLRQEPLYICWKRT